MTRHIGGIVLCGGRSSRMQRPKEWLPFAGRPMLCHVVSILQGVVAPVIVVAAPGQNVPELPASVRLVRDPVGGRGPVEGLYAGLSAMHDAEAAFVTSCDVPLLRASFISRIIQLLDDDHDVVVPVEETFHHPLAAVYRTSVRPILERMLAEQRLRPVFLYEQVRTRRVDVESLRDADPRLDSLRNLNRWEDYQAALRQAGSGSSAEGT